MTTMKEWFDREIRKLDVAEQQLTAQLLNLQGRRAGLQLGRAAWLDCAAGVGEFPAVDNDPAPSMEAWVAEEIAAAQKRESELMLASRTPEQEKALDDTVRWRMKLFNLRASYEAHRVQHNLGRGADKQED